MGELKSAWEIAQEKARKLGELSAEEQRQQLEERCQQIAQAITRRYLDQEGLDIATELNNCPEGEKDLVRQATLSYLTQGMELRNPQRLEKIAQGILSLEPKLQPIVGQIIELAREYEQAGSKIRQEIVNKGRETLHQLRISGTAVGNISIQATAEWQETWRRLIEPFEERLDSLKKGLVSSIRG